MGGFSGYSMKIEHLPISLAIDACYWQYCTIIMTSTWHIINWQKELTVTLNSINKRNQQLNKVLI